MQLLEMAATVFYTVRKSIVLLTPWDRQAKLCWLERTLSQANTQHAQFCTWLLVRETRLNAAVAQKHKANNEIEIFFSLLIQSTSKELLQHYHIQYYIPISTKHKG